MPGGNEVLVSVQSPSLGAVVVRVFVSEADLSRGVREAWIGLLREAGFTEPRVRWSTANSLRRPGRVLLGNRVAAWFTEGAFCLTMTLRR